jgi:hypothetical protein
MLTNLQAKTLGIVGAVGSLVIGVVAYGFYVSGRSADGLFWGMIALVWVLLSINNFRLARRQGGDY